MPFAFPLVFPNSKILVPPCKTGTMGTLANQAEIGVWVQAPAALLCGPGILPPEFFMILYAIKSCNIAHFGRKIVRSAVCYVFVTR